MIDSQKFFFRLVYDDVNTYITGEQVFKLLVFCNSHYDMKFKVRNNLLRLSELEKLREQKREQKENKKYI